MDQQKQVVEHEIRSYLDDVKAYGEEISETNLKIAQNKEDKLKIVEFSSKFGLWNKIKHRWDSRKDSSQLDTQLKGLQARLIRLTNECSARKSALISTLVKSAIERSSDREIIYQAQKHYESISRLLESSKNTISLAENVLTKVRAAITAVSSATTMEYIDLATKNKGVAAASSLFNIDANNAVNDVNRSLNILVGSIEKQSSFALELKTIKSSDFLMDVISIRDGFDFGSVFRLLKLGKAKDSLNNIEAKVLKLIPKLREVSGQIAAEQQRVSRVYLKLKQNTCGPVIETLQNSRVEFLMEDFIAVVEKYQV